MNLLKTVTRFAALATITAALSACGGGGSGAPSSSSSTTNVNQNPNATVDLSIPANTNPGSITYTEAERIAAFDRINQIRTQVGLGVLSQDTHLDQAAAAHASYNLANNNVGHYETASGTGFTGVDPVARTTAAAFAAPGSTVEVMVDGQATNDGNLFIDSLMTAIYHRMAMLRYSVDKVGLSPYTSGHMVMDMGVSPGQGAPTTPYTTWPQNNATGVATTGGNESPNPIPENNGAPYGNPISIQTHEGRILDVTSFTLTDSYGSSVQTKLLSYSTDTNLRTTYAAHFIAAVVPTAPLASATTYTAHFTGTLDGKSISYTWSFTTN